MASSVATPDAPAKDPHLPPLHRVGDVAAPRAPDDIPAARLEDGALTDLIVKLAYTVPSFPNSRLGTPFCETPVSYFASREPGRHETEFRQRAFPNRSLGTRG